MFKVCEVKEKLYNIYMNLLYPRSAVFVGFHQSCYIPQRGLRSFHQYAYNLDTEERKLLKEVIEYYLYYEDSISKIVKFYEKQLPKMLRYIAKNKKTNYKIIRASFRYEEYATIHVVRTPYIVETVVNHRARRYELATDILKFGMPNVENIISVVRNKINIFREIDIPPYVKKQIVELIMQGYSITIDKEVRVSVGSRSTSLASAGASFKTIYGEVVEEKEGEDCDGFGCFIFYKIKPKTPIAVIVAKSSETYPNKTHKERNIIILTR